MTGYQYQISERNPRAVEVRYKQAHAGRPTLWRLYQLCVSEDDAERMLGLLQEPLVLVLCHRDGSDGTSEQSGKHQKEVAEEVTP